MNGIHDMGGMEGLGPIEREENEPVFHAEWERRVLALTRAAAAGGEWNIDASRHSRERIPAGEYLRMSYYERWYTGLLTLLTEAGLVTPEELKSGRSAPGAPKGVPALRAERVAAALTEGRRTTREVPVEPKLRVGQKVRARNIHPHGHTRLPRYARGKVGMIDRQHGAHVFPDTNAHFQGENSHHLYSVRFEARELWGAEATDGGAVFIDLWEAYLEPA